MIRCSIPIVTALSLLSGCTAIASPSQTVAFVVPEHHEPSESFKTPRRPVDDMPAWFTSPPANTTRIIYATAASSAPTAAYAIDKAALNGRRVLAEQTNGVISAEMRDGLVEHGDGSIERASSRLTIGRAVAAVRDSDIIKRQVQPDEGGGYRAYVLMRGHSAQ